MATRDDRRAGVVLLSLAATGLVLRLILGGGGAPGAVLYRATNTNRPSHDSVAARSARLARPVVKGEKIDVDRAPAGELIRLPRIGPTLAARIVANRDSRGPFGSLVQLDRVTGIGTPPMYSVWKSSGPASNLRRATSRKVRSEA